MLRIKEARNARNWSQEELALALETTQQTIQRWESGQDIKSSQLLTLSKTLGVTVSFLMGLDESSQQQQLPPAERELLALYRNMDEKHKDLLLENARSFAALSVKDGAGVTEDVERAGIAVK